MTQLFDRLVSFLMNDMYSGFLSIVLPLGIVVILAMALWGMFSSEHGMAQMKGKIITVIIIIAIAYSARPIVQGLQATFN